jgi:tight adherence protein B
VTPAAAVLGALLLLAGGGILTWSGLRMRRQEGVDRLKAALAPPLLSRPAPAGTRVRRQLSSPVEFVARIVERLERLLAHAGWTMAPERLAGALAGCAVAAALFGAVLTGTVFGTLLFACAAPAVFVAMLVVKGRRTVLRLERQLPDVLQQLGAAMRAGSSLVQAMETTAAQFPAPIGPQLARLLGETQVGRPLDDALHAMVDRVGSRDLAWTVRAMTLQARTGGRLADLLDVLAEFMRDREEVAREVRALTAEGRISAYVLIALPLVVGGLLTALRPEYMGPLVIDPRGRSMLFAAGCAMAFGIALIRKIVRVVV